MLFYASAFIFFSPLLKPDVVLVKLFKLHPDFVSKELATGSLINDGWSCPVF